MSDTQEQRPKAQAEQEEPKAASTENPIAENAQPVVDNEERQAALNELEAARNQLQAAQKKMDEAQHRLDSLERGIRIPIDKSAENSAAPQGLMSTPKSGEAPLAEETAPAAETTASPEALPHYGVMNGLFDGFSKLGPIAIFIFMACMAWPIFMPSANLSYCPGEIKSLTAFLHMTATGGWMTPTGLDDGNWALAQWPVFSWCAAIISLIPGLAESGLLIPVLTFSCAFAAAFAVWALTIGTGFGGKAAMAAAIILLCAPLFAPMPHFVGPAALAAALMLFALLFFYRGWIASSSWICLPLAFIFTTLAGLCGGILHFATPIIVSICFLVWRGTFRRIHKLDAIFGFILMLAMIGCWLGGIMMGQNNEPYINSLFSGSWQMSFPIPLKWFLAMIIALVGLLPWVLMVFGVSWARVIAKSAKSFSASRHENGSAILWIAIVVAICLSIFTPGFHAAAIAIVCLGAPLLGKAFMRLPHLGNPFFFLLASICLIIAGLAILAMSFPTSQGFIINNLPWLPVSDLAKRILSLSALPVLGAIVLVGGLIGLFFVRHDRGAGGLFYAMLLVIVLCQPARLMLVPELEAMPGTPLVSYKTIVENVSNALANPGAPVQNAEPAASVPAQQSPKEAAPAVEPAEPAAPETPVISDTAPEPAAESGAAESGADVQTPQTEAPNQGLPPEEAKEIIIMEETPGQKPAESAQ